VSRFDSARVVANGSSRLSYNYDTLTLVVEMPSPPHEAVIKFINAGLENADRFLQSHIDDKLLYSNLHTNLTISAGAHRFTHDIAHVVTGRRIPPIKSIPIIGEVAKSQTEGDLLQRFRDVVQAFPDVLMLIMVVIGEGPYSAPRRHSDAWLKLGLETSVRSYEEFLSEFTEPQTLEVPTEIVVEGHSWCALSSVRFQVWVRSDVPIDVDTTESSLTARGVSLIQAYRSVHHD